MAFQVVYAYEWYIVCKSQTLGGINADEFNERLFKHDAGILPGRLCDMARRKDGPLEHFMRFSFGPLGPDSYEADMEILSKCV